MSRIGSQVRTPVSNARAKRNADDWSGGGSFIDANGAIALNSDGKLVLTVNASGGLQVTMSSLSIKLNGTDLTLTSDGISVSSTFREEVLDGIRRSVDQEKGFDASILTGEAEDFAMKVSLLNGA